MGVINNPSGKPSEDNTLLYRAIWAALITQKNKAAAEFVQKLLKEESSWILQRRPKIKERLIQVKEGLKIFIYLFYLFIHERCILLCNCVISLVGFDQVIKYCVPFDHHSVPQSVSEEEIIIGIIWGRKERQLAGHNNDWSWR